MARALRHEVRAAREAMAAQAAAVQGEMDGHTQRAARLSAAALDAEAARRAASAERAASAQAAALRRAREAEAKVAQAKVAEPHGAEPDVAEVQAVALRASMMHTSVDHDELRDRFDEFDKNGDGSIEFQEFKEFVKAHPGMRLADEDDAKI